MTKARFLLGLVLATLLRSASLHACGAALTRTVIDFSTLHERDPFVSMPKYESDPHAVWADLLSQLEKRQRMERVAQSAYWFEAHRAGEQHPRLLETLGFHLTEKSLVPPASLSSFFRQAYGAVAALVTNGKLGPQEAALPALHFMKLPGARADGKKVLYVRPGIDPWPSPVHYDLKEWDLNVRPEAIWLANADGRLPFPLNRRHFIEVLANFTDILETPAILRENVAHGRRIQLRHALDKGVIDWIEAGDRSYAPEDVDLPSGSAARAELLSGYVALPSLQHETVIRAALQEAVAGGSSRNEIEAHLRASGVAKWTAFATVLATQGPKWLTRHGAFLREPRLRENYAGVEVIDLSVRARLDGALHPPFGDRVSYVGESLHGRVVALGLLLSLEPDAMSLPRTEWNLSTSRAITADVRDEWVLRYAAEVAAGFQSGIDLQITPHDIYEESRGRAPGLHTKTVRFYGSFLEPADRTAEVLEIPFWNAYAP